MFKTILVPVDLGEVEAARPAIDKAVELATSSGGSLRLIYVRAIVPVTYMEFMPPAFDQEQQSEAEAKLADVAAGVGLPSDRVSAVVRLGSVYAEVLDEAEKTGADLIVVGSHRPTMATYLLGSNAATIVRHAKSSVLVVRA
ncbi:nucleotide-binding universal stress UspA family protein [Microvirga flocculans]|uniref:Universal stress protein n=1 Tax=Microvirga flocculans TaxID=217168 RepID=A0A7W6IE18_9HYPH|nr:universal stress protein [Microvirga flocculans]MBB4039758.1 nucleotide-binding universal stress UspA family protein [Microvirga flocculans]